MAKSTLAIDTNLIHDFENDTANSASDLDSTFSEIVAKFNTMLDTLTGHRHDGLDSRYFDASSIDDNVVIGIRMGAHISPSSASALSTAEQAITAIRMGAYA